MVRLPISGRDHGQWGDILNEFLLTAHKSDGSLLPVQQNNVQGLVGALAEKYTRPVNGIPQNDLSNDIQALLGRAANAMQRSETALNVRHYGAVGNGTTDDTVAIRAAVTAAKSSKIGLFFPPGTYLISGSLNVGGGFPGGMHIFGSGWASTIKIANNANCYAFVLGGVYTPGLQIRNLYIDCNGANQTAGGAIDADGAVWCRFEHLYINAPWQAGIYLHNDGTGGFGHHNTVQACRILEGRQSNGGNGYAILIDRSDENFISECTIADCGRAGVTENHMIYEKAGLQLFTKNAFVGGAVGATQLKLQGSNNIVVGNVFDGGTRSHQLRLNGGLNVVTGNRFYNIGNAAATVAEATSGIVIDNVKYNLLNSNSFSPINSGGGYAESAIKIMGTGAQFNDISNNVMALASTGIWHIAPINVSGGITGNAIRYNRGYAPGPQTAPSIPASGSPFTNPFSFDCDVYIAGGAVSGVALSGATTGVTQGCFKLTAGQTITLTYTSAPTWTWYGK